MCSRTHRHRVDDRDILLVSGNVSAAETKEDVMRRLFAVVLLLTLVTIGLPREARADGFLIPWAGVNFANDQEEGDVTFGAGAGFMGSGIAGLELDFGYAPDFFGEAVDNYVMTGMGSVILGVPVGGTGGPGIRPYVVAGLGMIRTRVALLGVSNATNEAGFNVGGGVLTYFGDHVGLRGDVRYFRNFSEIDISELQFAGSFHFWRASIGLVLR
jgi:opacity protein-like surface antigen